MNSINICQSCLSVQSRIHKFLLQKYGEKYLFRLITYSCSIFMEYRFCNQFVTNWGDIIYTALIKRISDPDLICSKLHFCTNIYSYQSADDFARNILKDKPKNQTLPEINTTAATWKVLQIADIHTDMDYEPVNKYVLCFILGIFGKLQLTSLL